MTKEWMTKRDLQIKDSADASGVRGPGVNGEYSVCCPFCEQHGHRDEKFKLQINVEKHVFYCYRCGAGGRMDTSWLDDTIDQQVSKPVVAPVVNLGPPEGFNRLDVRAQAHAPYVEYLRKRRVLNNFCQVGGGVCTSGKYAGRVVVPMFTTIDIYEGPWLGFSARSIHPGIEPKYLYPAGMNRRGNLWGLPWAGAVFFSAGSSGATRIWLVEGVFDALPLWPRAVAAFGKNVTDEQVQLLCRIPWELVICLDGDAWEEAWALASRFVLHGKTNVRWCKLPPCQDPGSLGWKVADYIQDL